MQRGRPARLIARLKIWPTRMRHDGQVGQGGIVDSTVGATEMG